MSEHETALEAFAAQRERMLPRTAGPLRRMRAGELQRAQNTPRRPWRVVGYLWDSQLVMSGPTILYTFSTEQRARQRMLELKVSPEHRGWATIRVEKRDEQ